jgi:hypothetical protein
VNDYQIVSSVSKGKFSKVTYSPKANRLEEEKVQFVNRVFASADKTRGTLHRYHAVRGNSMYAPNIPEHCIVDNGLTTTIDQIDKQVYIKMAKQYIEDYTGVHPDHNQLSFLF